MVLLPRTAVLVATIVAALPEIIRAAKAEVREARQLDSEGGRKITPEELGEIVEAICAAIGRRIVPVVLPDFRAAHTQPREDT